jgi:hypothetical protein
MLQSPFAMLDKVWGCGRASARLDCSNLWHETMPDGIGTDPDHMDAGRGEAEIGKALAAQGRDPCLWVRNARGRKRQSRPDKGFERPAPGADAGLFKHSLENGKHFAALAIE